MAEWVYCMWMKYSKKKKTHVKPRSGGEEIGSYICPHGDFGSVHGNLSWCTVDMI